MKYRAIVTKVGTKGRIKVKCPDIWNKQESPWCYPCIPFLNLAYQPKTKKNVNKDECKCSVRIPTDLYESTKIKMPNVDSKLNSRLEELMEEIKDLIKESTGGADKDDEKDEDKKPGNKPVETPEEPEEPKDDDEKEEEDKGEEFTLMKPNDTSKRLTADLSEKCNLKYVIRLPEIGEYVWLEFEKDDVNSTPIYVGTWGDEEFWNEVESEL